MNEKIKIFGLCLVASAMLQCGGGGGGDSGGGSDAVSAPSVQEPQMESLAMDVTYDPRSFLSSDSTEDIGSSDISYQIVARSLIDNSKIAEATVQAAGNQEMSVRLESKTKSFYKAVPIVIQISKVDSADTIEMIAFSNEIKAKITPLEDAFAKLTAALDETIKSNITKDSKLDGIQTLSSKTDDELILIGKTSQADLKSGTDALQLQQTLKNKDAVPAPTPELSGLRVCGAYGSHFDQTKIRFSDNEISVLFENIDPQIISTLQYISTSITVTPYGAESDNVYKPLFIRADSNWSWFNFDSDTKFVDDYVKRSGTSSMIYTNNVSPPLMKVTWKVMPDSNRAELLLSFQNMLDYTHTLFTVKNYGIKIDISQSGTSSIEYVPFIHIEIFGDQMYWRHPGDSQRTNSDPAYHTWFGNAIDREPYFRDPRQDDPWDAYKKVATEKVTNYSPKKMSSACKEQ